MIKKKIIITGGSGYIGSSLANFLSDNCEVITLDKRKKNNFLNNKIKHFTCNIINKKKIKNLLIKIKPDVLVHLAGQSTIDLVEKEKNKYYRNNILATNILVEIVKELKISKFIFSSTAAIYDKSNHILKETNKIKSNNSYGLSKIKCEKIIVENLKFSQTKYCILRFFNVASSLKEKKIGEIHNPETHLIPILINSLHSKKNIHIYGNKYKTKDGTCLRDYIHIYDILSGIKKSINFLEKNKSDIFNLGSGRCYSVIDVVKNCEKIYKKKTYILFKKIRKYDSEILMCDISKANKLLKWRPLKSNLRKIINDEIWWFKYLIKKRIKRKYIY
jgi:UDP-glucose 4-epimerase